MDSDAWTRSPERRRTKSALNAFSSYYDDCPALDEQLEPTALVPTASDAAEAGPQHLDRRKKRERAATFVNDEAARQLLASQLQQYEVNEEMEKARLRHEERLRQQRVKDKEAREGRRRKERAAALARLEALEAQEAQLRQDQSHFELSQEGRATTYQAGMVDAEQSRRIHEHDLAQKALRDAEIERARVQELEQEVARLRRELDAAKERPNHPRDHDSLTIATSAIDALSYESPAPPPPPPRPLPAGAVASPIAYVAARRASLAKERSLKGTPSTGLGMVADMSKFLAEMKATKLKKVGPPLEGADKLKSKTDEDAGLKSVLEQVLKKRFIGKTKDYRGSASTAGSSTVRDLRSEHSRTSNSPDTSLTSFSSYRPPDWSVELDNAPIPPRPQISMAVSRHGQQNSTSSLPIPETIHRYSFGKPAPTSRVLSHPASTPKKPNQPRVHLARNGIRPQAAIGHALTTDEFSSVAESRLSASKYAFPRLQPLAVSPSSSAIAEGTGSVRERKISDRSAATMDSVRTKGSSFDIDIYGQMQLREDGDDFEDEMRRSLSNPPCVDGTMDMPAPARIREQIERPIEINFATYTQEQPPVPVVVAHTNFVTESQPARRKTSQGFYRNPRPAPIPPLGASYLRKRHTSNGNSLLKPNSMSSELLDKSSSPQKPRQRAGRVLPGSAQYAQENIDILCQDVHMTEEEADELLRDDDSLLVAYGSQ